MSDSYFEDRSIDHSPDIEDWSHRGEKEDRERQKEEMEKDFASEQEDMARDKAEIDDYGADLAYLEDQIKQLDTLKEKLLPLLKEISDKEGDLIDLYGRFFDGDPYNDEYHISGYETENDQKSHHLYDKHNYEIITPWINQFTPITEDIEKQKELDEIRRQKEENLRQHKKRLGIEEEPDEVPF